LIKLTMMMTLLMMPINWRQCTYQKHRVAGSKCVQFFNLFHFRLENLHSTHLHCRIVKKFCYPRQLYSRRRG